MGHTICLLTAAMVTGQTGQNNVTYQTKIIVPPSSAAVQQQPIKQGALEKIRIWWSQNRPNVIPRMQKRIAESRTSAKKGYYPRYSTKRPVYRQNPTQPAGDNTIRPKTMEPPLAGDDSVKFRPVTNSKIRNVPMTDTTIGRTPGLRLSPEVANHCGNDTKHHKWITGQLHKHGRVWVLVYAGENVVDRYQGRVALPHNLDMRQFKAGDLVSVSGHVQNRQLGGMQLYHVDSILPVAIPKR